MNPAGATRQIYWNISHIWVMYVLLLPTLAMAAYGVYRHLRNWRRGAPAARFDQPARRINLVLKHPVAQGRNAREGYRRACHRFHESGLLILTLPTNAR